MNKYEYLQKLYFILKSKGLNQSQILKALNIAKQDISDKEESFKDFLEIQKILEPKWSYEEKFFKKVINDFNFFVNPEQSLTDLLFLVAPPRTGKTELMSVFGIPYLLSRFSGIRILVNAGNQALKRKIKKGVTRVVKSYYYNKKYNISLTTNNANEVITTNNNLVFFTTTSSETPTGEGFHFVFAVDPLTYSMIKSEAKTQNAFEQADGLFTRTQDDPRTKFIVDSQRLSAGDFFHRLNERYKSAEQTFHTITMPYFFTENTDIQDLEGNVYNFKENEYLINRFNKNKKDLIVAKIGLIDFETQYQQNPISTTDCILKPHDLENTYIGNPIEMAKSDYFDSVIMSLDTASKKNKNSDNTAITLAGIKNSDIYILDVITIKEEFNEIRASIESLRDIWRPDYILIEDASTGTALISHFKNHYFTDLDTGMKRRITPIALNPNGKSKIDRLKSCLHFFYNKRIKIPEYAKWLPNWKHELLRFPNVAHDDQVDSLSQLLIWKNNYSDIKLY